MYKQIARRMVRRFGGRYGYDTAYMEHMLDVSPRAFRKFAHLPGLSAHVEAAPKNAVFAAKLIGAMHEDCGPCAQLVVNMAKEAGVPDTEIEALAREAGNEMSPDTYLGWRFARAVLDRSLEADEIREQVRARWGDKGVIDLTLSLQIGRVFPMVKAGLGFATTCQQLEVGGRPVAVTPKAA